MPTLTCPVSELVHHVYAPVVRQLAHRILKCLNMEQAIGNEIFISADWITHSATSDANDNPKVRKNRFMVEPQLQLNPTSQKWDVYSFEYTAAYGIGEVFKNRSMPIYRDPINDIKINELVSPVTITLNCELVIQQTELAFETPTKIFNQFENGAIYKYHDLSYDYPVPKLIISVLFKIWELDREYGKPANVSFMDYIKAKTYNQCWSIMKQRDTEEYELTVPCYNLKALATLEYSEDKPQGVMENKLPVGWSIPFTYTVQFGVPNTLALIYPCVINNQLVPDYMLNFDEQSRYNAIIEKARHGSTYENYTNYLKSNEHLPIPYLQTPWYDDWVLPQGNSLEKSGLIPFLIMHVLVDEDKGLYTTIDLNEPFDDKVSMSEVTKAFLHLEGREAVDRHSPYCVAVFRDDKELDPTRDYSIDTQMKVHFKAFDLYAHYRIVIAVVRSVTTVRPKWYRLLLRFFAVLPVECRDSIIRRIREQDWSYWIKDFLYAYDLDWSLDKSGYLSKLLLDEVLKKRLASLQIERARGNSPEYYGTWVDDLEAIIARLGIDPSKFHVGDIDILRYTQNVGNGLNEDWGVFGKIDPLTGCIYYPGEELPGGVELEDYYITLSNSVTIEGLRHANNTSRRIDRATFITRSASLP